MSLNDQKNKYRALDDWFKTSQGKHVSSVFYDVLTGYHPILKGACVAQIGSCYDNLWLDALDFKRQWVLTPCRDNFHAHLVGSPLALPFDRQSMDCVIAPFALEILNIEKNPLDEFDRILRPMGYLVLWGVNPFSLWGLFFRIGCLDIFGQNKPYLISPFALKQHLVNRNFKQICLETFYYIPPFKSRSLIHSFHFLNEMGKMITPLPAGFYCLIVQKYQESLIHPVQRRRTRLRFSDEIALQS